MHCEAQPSSDLKTSIFSAGNEYDVLWVLKDEEGSAFGSAAGLRRACCLETLDCLRRELSWLFHACDNILGVNIDIKVFAKIISNKEFLQDAGTNPQINGDEDEDEDGIHILTYEGSQNPHKM
ncbi:hypothetical protein PIB30_046014 [Stylosanthes scabra]|uniref:Uncharacterized protein n=1 Tax=Stylosanthes scabra TaxID=79078 RepID=A0ABU6WGC8_9FABA|nr:hypothetical protein [Stylosanthes scabra]